VEIGLHKPTPLDPAGCMSRAQKDTSDRRHESPRPRLARTIGAAASDLASPFRRHLPSWLRGLGGVRQHFLARAGLRLGRAGGGVPASRLGQHHSAGQTSPSSTRPPATSMICLFHGWFLDLQPGRLWAGGRIAAASKGAGAPGRSVSLFLALIVCRSAEAELRQASFSPI